MVVIDSDVLLLAFAYPNDDRQKMNRIFLETVQTAQPATTIYNVMETLGQLSFNLSADQLDGWQDWLINAYNLTVVHQHIVERFRPLKVALTINTSKNLRVISKKCLRCLDGYLVRDSTMS